MVIRPQALSILLSPFKQIGSWSCMGGYYWPAALQRGLSSCQVDGLAYKDCDVGYCFSDVESIFGIACYDLKLKNVAYLSHSFVLPDVVRSVLAITLLLFDLNLSLLFLTHFLTSSLTVNRMKILHNGSFFVLRISNTVFPCLNLSKSQKYII